jgi:hypothetical protein
MYFKSSRILGLAALAVGLSLTATSASAQQATFHLPFVAHWGQTVLEPGDYKLSATAGWSAIHLIQVFSQQGHSSSMLPQSIDLPQGHLDRSSLELVNVNGAYFVKRYKSALTGQVFTFPVPKATPETEMASAAMRAVPVEGAK